MTKYDERVEEINSIFQRRARILESIGILIHNNDRTGRVGILLKELGNTRVRLSNYR